MDLLLNFPKHIFRAYDIRGTLTLLTPKTVASIASALAEQYLQAGQKKIALGYDARLSSPNFAVIIKKVLEEKGVEVIEVECCSTPMLYYIARQCHGNGIMITASHNPKSDNGIKWILKSEPPTPEQIQAIAKQAEKFYFAQSIPNSNMVTRQHKAKHQISIQYTQQYCQALIQDIHLSQPFKVVLDGMHGSAGLCAKEILQKLNVEVIALRCEPNGEFPDHAPDPSHATHIEQLCKEVQKHQASLGIALDGDGDRVVLVDDQAQIVSPDRLICLFAMMCLEQKPQAEIVYDVKCSGLVAQTIQRLGGRASMIRTGSSFLRRYLSQSKGEACFGGEYAGHYVFNDGRGFGYDDGIYAALRVLEYLALKQSRLSDVIAQIPKYYSTEDTYISTYQIEPTQVLDELANMSQSILVSVSHIDGIRLDFDEGFGLIRASNTGDYFTVRFDAQSPLKLAQIKHRFVSMLTPKYPKIAEEISKIH